MLSALIRHAQWPAAPLPPSCLPQASVLSWARSLSASSAKSTTCTKSSTLRKLSWPSVPRSTSSAPTVSTNRPRPLNSTERASYSSTAVTTSSTPPSTSSTLTACTTASCLYRGTSSSSTPSCGLGRSLAHSSTWPTLWRGCLMCSTGSRWIKRSTDFCCSEVANTSASGHRTPWVTGSTLGPPTAKLTS